MRELGMGALLAVGVGSYNEPLIVLRWEPPDAAGGYCVLVLVGGAASTASRSSPPRTWRT